MVRDLTDDRRYCDFRYWTPRVLYIPYATRAYYLPYNAQTTTM